MTSALNRHSLFLPLTCLSAATVWTQMFWHTDDPDISGTDEHACPSVQAGIFYSASQNKSVKILYNKCLYSELMIVLALNQH